MLFCKLFVLQSATSMDSSSKDADLKLNEEQRLLSHIMQPEELLVEELGDPLPLVVGIEVGVGVAL